MKIILHWKHLQENYLLNLQCKQDCVYQHDLQQNRCIYIYIKQIWYTNSPTQIMKQEGIFFSNTVQQLIAFLYVFIVHNMLNFNLKNMPLQHIIQIKIIPSEQNISC